MTNALNELKAHLTEIDAEIVCAEISLGYIDTKELASLEVGYSPTDLGKFFVALNIDYDSGYGGQELFGTIWLTNGVWLTRGEYDGSEWWDVHTYPAIPKTLTGGTE